MTNNCPALATKQELSQARSELAKAIDTKIPKSQKESIVNEGGLKGKELVAGSIALVGATANNALNSAGNALNQAQSAKGLANVARFRADAATNKAVSATLDAKLAGRQASKAINSVGTVASTAGRALGMALNVVSLLSTMATAAQLAILTKQVANLRQRQLEFEAETKKRLSKLQFTADSAFNMARTNAKVNKENQARLNEQKHLIDANKHEITKINTQIELQKKENEVIRSQIEKTNKDVAETNQKIVETNQKIPQIINQETSSLKKDITTLKDNNQVLSKAANQANQKVNKLQSDLNQYKITEAAKEAAKQGLDFVTRPELDSKIKKTEKKAHEETLQERLRRERQEKIDEVHKSQEELRRERQEKIDQKYKSQQELRIQRQEQILNAQIERGLFDKQGLKIDKQVNQEIQKQANNQNQNVNRKLNSFEQKIDKKIEDIEQVNNKQAAEINSKLNNLNLKVPKLITPTNVAIAVGGSEVIRQIVQKTSKVSPCQAPALVPPVVAQTTATNATLLGFQTASLAQTTAIQKTVTITKNIVSHGKHGLEAIQKAADFAWKATHADKALQMLNTVLLVSVYFNITRNIGEGLGDIASLVLSTLNIKDSTGENIDVNQVIGTSIKNWISNRIGQANFNKLESKMIQSNRVYQSVTNLYGSVRNMFATAQDIAEETGVDVAKIGNALRDSGAVESDSYGQMAENPRRRHKLLQALEKTSDVVDIGQSIASDTNDFVDEAKEFNQERKELLDTLNKEKEDINKLETEEQNKIEKMPDITEADKLESPDN